MVGQGREWTLNRDISEISEKGEKKTHHCTNNEEGAGENKIINTKTIERHTLRSSVANHVPAVRRTMHTYDAAWHAVRLNVKAT